MQLLAHTPTLLFKSAPRHLSPLCGSRDDVGQAEGEEARQTVEVLCGEVERRLSVGGWWISRWNTDAQVGLGKGK